MEQQLLQTGEETISKLAGRAAEVQGLVSANFAAKSLADVQASFEAAFASGAPAAVNAEVVKVHTIVREQAAQVLASLLKRALSCSGPCGRPPSTCCWRAPERGRGAPRHLHADEPPRRPLVLARPCLTAPPWTLRRLRT